ncbi:MAG: hypothetical protein ACFFCQ_11750 [Promethearchaeota archaeon]
MENPLLKVFEQAAPHLCFLQEVQELIKSYSPDFKESPTEFLHRLIQEHSSNTTIVTDLKIVLTFLEK